MPRPTALRRPVLVAYYASSVLVFAGLITMAMALVWNFSTHRYLAGFADAIIPLSGTPEQKTKALLEWFHHQPRRNAVSASETLEGLNDRDPVDIVQDARLLSVCGTASNAFMNLADAAGLKVRRLLLIDKNGEAMHVVAEVQWGDRWIVVNPQQGLLFTDASGRALTRQELHDPAVFRDAISRMPGYDPDYTFERTIHIRLARIPLVGTVLRKSLDRFTPGWEEAVNWTYFPEYPPFWLLAISIVLLIVGITTRLLVGRFERRGLAKHAA